MSANVTLPATFMKRGFAVPFTTAMLRFARIRLSASRQIEFLVSGLSEDSRTFVIPFKELPETVTLSVHDRVLMEAFEQIETLKPVSIREEALKAAISGYAGPVMARKARERLMRDRDNRAMVFVALLGEAATRVGVVDKGEVLDPAKLSTPEGMTAAKKAISGFARAANISGQELFQDLEEWADMISVVGSPDGSAKGYLLENIDRLEAMSAHLMKWLIPEPPETAEMAQRTAIAAKEAASISRTAAKAVNDMVDDMAGMLKDWREARRIVRRNVDRLSFLLDGWNGIAEAWEAVDSKSRPLQRDTIEWLAQNLPVLPSEALEGSADIWTDLRQRQKRWVEESQISVAEDVDQKTRDRLTRYKTEGG